MRTTAFILTLILNWTFLFAQTTDIDSLITEERLISALEKQFTITEYDGPNIIMPFNSDTILIAGSLSDFSIGYKPKNVVYRTMDGGTTWELLKFKGDAWIYDTYFQKDGKVWMGGSDEYIHFSKDYGSTWTVKPKPFNPINRVLSIYMIDSLNGIAGGLGNGLAITNDNWQTTTQIPSPLDQNKFTITKNSARDRIDKLAILDSIILINQNDHIYYSKLNPIEWKEFNIPVTDFSLDKLNKQWSIFSLGNKVFVLSSTLGLIKTYTKEPEYTDFYELKNTPISFVDFLASKRITLIIKAVKFDLEGKSGGSLPIPIYKENVMEIKVDDINSITKLKEILSTTNIYDKPILKSFSFTSQDFASYQELYIQTKKTRQEEKVWGGDFTSLLNIDGEYFMNPDLINTSLNQSLLDSVYNFFSYRPFLCEQKETYIILTLINSRSETLKISSVCSILFSLPWTIEYKGETFQTYDTRITEYLRSILPKDNNYYENLFAGELIYRLIEQQTINELEYKNGY